MECYNLRQMLWYKYEDHRQWECVCDKQHTCDQKATKMPQKLVWSAATKYYFHLSWESLNREVKYFKFCKNQLHYKTFIERFFVMGRMDFTFTGLVAAPFTPMKVIFDLINKSSVFTQRKEVLHCIFLLLGFTKNLMNFLRHMGTSIPQRLRLMPGSLFWVEYVYIYIRSMVRIWYFKEIGWRKNISIIYLWWQAPRKRWREGSVCQWHNWRGCSGQ